MAQNPIHVTISDDATIEFVRGKVSSGEYASETDVVDEVLLMFKEEQAEFERWMREVILPRIDAAEADPASLIPIAQVEANLAARRRQRSARAS